MELFIILWVTKLIHNKQPMYAVSGKDTIKNKIRPHLSVAKRGFVSKGSLIEVINAILYKLKTGCQWAYLPVKELFSGRVLKYRAVFYHYNKWSKKGEWKSAIREGKNARRLMPFILQVGKDCLSPACPPSTVWNRFEF